MTEQQAAALKAIYDYTEGVMRGPDHKIQVARIEPPIKPRTIASLIKQGYLIQNDPSGSYGNDLVSFTEKGIVKAIELKRTLDGGPMRELDGGPMREL